MLTLILIGFLLTVLCVFVYVLAASFILWMVVDAAKNDKFWWVVLCLGLPGIGALIYYFVEKEKYYKVKPHVHKDEESLSEK